MKLLESLILENNTANHSKSHSLLSKVSVLGLIMVIALHYSVSMELENQLRSRVLLLVQTLLAEKFQFLDSIYRLNLMKSEN